jgi:hypothetical protein
VRYHSGSWRTYAGSAGGPASTSMVAAASPAMVGGFASSSSSCLTAAASVLCGVDSSLGAPLGAAPALPPPRGRVVALGFAAFGGIVDVVGTEAQIYGNIELLSITAQRSRSPLADHRTAPMTCTH